MERVAIPNHGAYFFETVQQRNWRRNPVIRSTPKVGPQPNGRKKQKCPEGLHHGCHWRRRKNLRGLTPSVSNTMGALWKEGENTRAPHWAFLRSGEVENFENLNNSFPFFLIWGFGCGHKQKWAQKFPFKHFEDLAMDICESCWENQCNVNLTACFDIHWRK